MAPKPTKTPPVPPTIPNWLATGKGAATPPPSPSQAPTPTTLPNWLTGGGQAGTTTGTSQPPPPVVSNVAQRELRAQQRETNQAQRAAERAGVPQQTITDIVEQKEPNVGLKVLGKVLNFDILPGGAEFKPVQAGIIKPLETIDIGRRAIVGALSPEVGIMEAIKDPTLSSKDAFNINTGNKVLDWTLGFTTDVLLDPVTYLTFGTGGIVKSAATGLAREGAMVTTRQIARTAIKEAGEAAVKQADLAKQKQKQFVNLQKQQPEKQNNLLQQQHLRLVQLEQQP